MASYPVTFQGEDCKVTHENPDGTLTVERQDRTQFPFGGIWFGVSPWKVEPA